MRKSLQNRQVSEIRIHLINLHRGFICSIFYSVLTSGVGVHQIAELVRHDKFLAAIVGWYDIEQEGAAVGVGAASGVPVLVSAAPESLVLGGEALQHRVYDLLLRAAERNPDLATLVGKDLWPEHAGVGDSDQSVSSPFGLCYDEEPWAVGAAVDVSPLDSRVHLLLFLGKHHVVELACGR